jgi:MYXO-CTERM domain-containing protein
VRADGSDAAATTSDAEADAAEENEDEQDDQDGTHGPPSSQLDESSDLSGLSSAPGREPEALRPPADGVGTMIVRVVSWPGGRPTSGRCWVGQVRADDQVSPATLRLDLRAPEAVANDDGVALPGFFGGLPRGWDRLLTVASVAVTAMGYGPPFLVLLALAGAGWLGVARRRRSASPEAAA